MSQLPKCAFIAIAINRYDEGGTLSSVKHASCRIYEGKVYDDKDYAEQSELVKLAELPVSGSSLGVHNGFLLCYLYRVDDQWFVQAVAEGAPGREGSHCVGHFIDCIRKHHKPRLAPPTRSSVVVELPEGVPPGSNFPCQVPSGFVVDVRVPANARPGERIKFSVPPGS